MCDHDSDYGIPRSPGLKPLHYSYKPQPSPQPDIRPRVAGPSSDEDDNDEAASAAAAAAATADPHAHSRRATKSKGSCRERSPSSILIYYIDRDQPEVARQGRLRDDSPLPPGSSLAAGNQVMVDTKPDPLARSESKVPLSSPTSDASRLQRAGVVQSEPVISRPNGHFSEADLGPSSHHRQHQASRSHVASTERKRSSPPLPQRLSTGPEESRRKRPRDGRSECLARSSLVDSTGPQQGSVGDDASMSTSPLANYMIQKSGADECTLPAISAPSPAVTTVLSPPEALPSVSDLERQISNGPENVRPPESRQRGISDASMGTSRTIHSRASSRGTLGSSGLLPPFQPQSLRPTSTPRSFPDSSPPSVPCGDFSPPDRPRGSADGQQNGRRGPSRGVPLLRTYQSSTNSSGDGSLPSLSSIPTNASTSTDDMTPSNTTLASPSERQMSADTPHSGPTYANYMGGQMGSFKCNHAGCDALPFSTQYLLNSHTNVHSQDRPHFCEVQGCPRSERGKNGEGGKGFKRKNEMVRHGLVHESPGYICPWCPDRAHKYPRPDNLQRHVRMHHDDKPKDDPGLRDILAQRFAPSQTRGRKKRVG